MNTTTRTLLGIGITVAAGVAGVAVARAAQSPTKRPTPAAVAPILVDGNTKPLDANKQPTAAAVKDLSPVIAPVMTGDGPGIAQALLDAPAPAAAQPGGPVPAAASPIVGAEPAPGSLPDVPAPGSTIPPSTDGIIPPGATPVDLTMHFVWDPATARIIPLPPIHIDPCAGAAPGSTPPGCPAGSGATLLSGSLPPAPFLFLNRPHDVDRSAARAFHCDADVPPAAGQDALTAYSYTPMSSITVEYRPWHSSAAWAVQTVAPTPASIVTDYQTQIDSRPFSPVWGVIPHCFNLTRDQDQPFEVRAHGVDVYGRSVNMEGTMVLPDRTPQGRPPTEATIQTGLPTRAVVKSYAKPTGMVKYRTRLVPADSTDTTCNLANEVPAASVNFATGGIGPLPSGVYDPAYSATASMEVVMPPGGRVVVCADIFDNHNPLTPAASDRLVLDAPSSYSPKLSVAGVRLNSGATLSAWDLYAYASTGDIGTDPCVTGTYGNHDALTGSVTIDAPLWQCSSSPPATWTGLTIPVDISRRMPGSGGTRHQTASLAINLAACELSCAPRPTDWYEVPIPFTTASMCGSSFGSCDPGGDRIGTVILKVEYQVVNSRRDLSGDGVTLAESSDRPAAPATGRPTASQPTFTVNRWTGHPTSFTGHLHFFTDRPARVAVEWHDAIYGTAGCPGATVPAGATAQTEFDIDVPGLCPGSAYNYTLHLFDSTGAEFLDGFPLANPVPMYQSSSLHTTVQFLGGAATFGWLYQFGVTLDGVSPTAYWWDMLGPKGAAGNQCIRLANQTAENRGFSPMVFVTAPTLSVDVHMNITTSGDTDCGGSGGLGVVDLHGEFTMADVASGHPLVLESPAGAAVRVRVTIDPGTSGWELR